MSVMTARVCSRVCVVGSVNADLTFTVNALPRPGQTVLASSLLSSPGGKGGNQAVAAARAGASVQLVAALGNDSAAEELRAHLAAKVLEYMVPAAYVRRERLPLTPNGKLDRKALPAPEADAYVVRGYEAPQGEIETTLAGIWAEVLKLERVGRHDNFFELGGHSLLAVTMIERMRRIGFEVDVRSLFATPTLASLVLEIRL